VGPLADVRVVDLTTVVVGPTATLYLADYGSDVIKVEAPGGDLLRALGGQSKSGELSGKFMHFNRNKRSLVLDLKQERGREALHRLLETADVFIANVRPTALERLGLGADALRERHNRLIVCNLTGFGAGRDATATALLTTPSSKASRASPIATAVQPASPAMCRWCLPTTWLD